MNAEQMKEMKRINALAAANCKSESSAFAIKVVLGLVSAAATAAGLFFLVKIAGL